MVENSLKLSKGERPMGLSFTKIGPLVEMNGGVGLSQLAKQEESVLTFKYGRTLTEMVSIMS
jgi:hypothetical protein